MAFTIHILLDLRHAGIFVKRAYVATLLSLLIEDHKADQALGVHQRAVHEMMKLLNPRYC